MIEPDFSETRILIVDSDVYLSKIIMNILLAFDVGKVTLCHSVEDGEKALRKFSYDCVFVDCMKFSRAGLKLIEWIRRHSDEKISETPIILCTAFTEEENIIRARDKGVTEILVKPVSPEQIMLKLISALWHKRDFIRSETYVGPDRRRRRGCWDGQERRTQDKMTQKNIDQFMDDGQEEMLHGGS
tara:strand:- start:1657 stop:2214 length:558 start_codon:yes stop_codon:yes gene_type:complete